MFEVALIVFFLLFCIYVIYSEKSLVKGKIPFSTRLEKKSFFKKVDYNSK